MNYLLAKIKNNSRSVKEGFQKILSDEECYTMPKDIEFVPYHPHTLLEEGQWYLINDFLNYEFCPELLRNDYCSADFILMGKRDLGKIDYLCSCQNGIYYFQKVRPKHFVQNKKIISFGENYELVHNTKGIVINDLADAIYCKDTDRFYFQNFETITYIFKGIDQLYREATEQEVESFLKCSFISPERIIAPKSVKKRCRKKIALALSKLEGHTEEERSALLSYTQSYANLTDGDGKFIITNEDDLTKLLRGIFELYFTTPVSGRQRVANSIIELP